MILEASADKTFHVVSRRSVGRSKTTIGISYFAKRTLQISFVRCSFSLVLKA